MRNASARAFVKAAAQTRALEVKQAREENERERQGERSERIMALRQAAELLKMSQVAARGHLGPGGTKMMWAYAREPFPIANVVSVAEAEQVHHFKVISTVLNRTVQGPIGACPRARLSCAVTCSCACHRT